MLELDIFTIISHVQHALSDVVYSSLNQLKHEASWKAYGSLCVVGFLYGILHAAGPGHGKAVVTHYMLTEEKRIRRGLVIVLCASLLQALTAITLVVGGYSLFNMTQQSTETMAILLEKASFGFIAFLGILAIIKGITLAQARSHPNGCGCHHHVSPSPDHAAQHLSRTQLITMIASIGLRPCSGGIILLILSCTTHVIEAGIAATIAMALGTAMTTGSLALLAVSSKKWAHAYIESSEKGLRYFDILLRLGGGIVLLVIAFLCLLSPTTPPMTQQQHPLYSLHR